MIEKMKKITLVCLHDERESTVDVLADLGLVHVAEVTPPQSQTLDDLLARQARTEQAQHLLSGRERGESKSMPSGGWEDSDIQHDVDAALQVAQRLEGDQEKLRSLERDLEALQPWGSFQQETVDELQRHGVTVKFCSALESQMPELPEEAVVQVVSRRKKQLFFTVLAPPGVQLPEELPEVAMPPLTSVAEIEKSIHRRQEAMRLKNAQLDALASRLPELERHFQELNFQVQFARAREGMGTGGSLAWLQGYVPERQLDALRQAASQHGWALQISAPEASDEKVPTKVTLPRWVEPIRVVFKAMGIMPGYREVDISAWFMIFLSVFFAMLIGDAGYGLLFLVGTVGLRAKFRQAPSQPFWLVGVFAVCTMVWGALNGTYFGVQQGLWGPLSGLKLTWVTGPEGELNIMRLCFFLGALHLTIAHSWNAVIYGKSLKSVRELGWAVTVWGNFFLARLLVCGDPVQDMVVGLFVPGLITVVLTTVFIEFGFVTLLLMVFGIINAFVDVVSYIRLYAVGMATVAVAQSFNNMAVDMSLPIWIKPPVMILILLLGHGLNIVLGAMSVLVHGVRLNVLEFSQHLGLEWTGVQYQPLARKRSVVKEGVN